MLGTEFSGYFGEEGFCNNFNRVCTWGVRLEGAASSEEVVLYLGQFLMSCLASY